MRSHTIGERRFRSANSMLSFSTALGVLMRLSYAMLTLSPGECNPIPRQAPCAEHLSTKEEVTDDVTDQVVADGVTIDSDGAYSNQWGRDRRASRSYAEGRRNTCMTARRT